MASECRTPDRCADARLMGVFGVTRLGITPPVRASAGMSDSLRASHLVDTYEPAASKRLTILSIAIGVSAVILW